MKYLITFCLALAGLSAMAVGPTYRGTFVGDGASLTNLPITNTVVVTWAANNTNSIYLNGAAVAAVNLKYDWNSTIGGWTNGTKIIADVIESGIPAREVMDIPKNPAGGGYYAGPADDYGGNIAVVGTWIGVSGGNPPPVGSWGTNTFNVTNTIITFGSSLPVALNNPSNHLQGIYESPLLVSNAIPVSSSLTSIPYYLVYDRNGKLWFEGHIEVTTDSINDRITQYGLPNEINTLASSGFQILRINGASTYFTNADNRGLVELATAFGTNGNKGVIYELLTLKELGFTNTQSGLFTHPIRIDGRGGVAVGNNPESIHTVLWNAPADLYVARPDPTRAQFVLGGAPAFTGSSTNGQFRSDGKYVSLTQNGATGVIPVPTNTATDGQVLTATGTAGDAKWAAAGGGSQTPWAQPINAAGFPIIAGGYTTSSNAALPMVNNFIYTGGLNGDSNNTIYGFSAGINWQNKTRTNENDKAYNTFFGSWAGSANWYTDTNTSGYYNSAFGFDALHDNKSGFENTAVGLGALKAIGAVAASAHNTAVGDFTGYHALDGTGATLIGESAGGTTTNLGTGNTFVGYNAGAGSSVSKIGDGNTGVGGSSMLAIKTGTLNSGVGYTQFGNLTTGGNNVGLGYRVGNNLVSGSYNIYIGGDGITQPCVGNSADSATVNIGSYTYGYLGNIAGTYRFEGGVVVTNTFASYSSNKLALTPITIGASPFNWTNTTAKNLFVFISQATPSAIAINGFTIATNQSGTLNGLSTVPLQPGEWVTLTYIDAPQMNWKPF